MANLSTQKGQLNQIKTTTAQAKAPAVMNQRRSLPRPVQPLTKPPQALNTVQAVPAKTEEDKGSSESQNTVKSSATVVSRTAPHTSTVKVLSAEQVESDRKMGLESNSDPNKYVKNNAV